MVFSSLFLAFDGHIKDAILISKVSCNTKAKFARTASSDSSSSSIFESEVEASTSLTLGYHSDTMLVIMESQG
jgi:hypothetical protein